MVAGGRRWCRIGDGTGLPARMDLRTVGRRVRTLAPYKSCRHYSVTPGLNLSRDRKLDADGNADLSDAKRSRVAPAYVTRVSRLIFLGSPAEQTRHAAPRHAAPISLPPDSSPTWRETPQSDATFFLSGNRFECSSYLSRCLTISS